MDYLRSTLKIFLLKSKETSLSFKACVGKTLGIVLLDKHVTVNMNSVQIWIKDSVMGIYEEIILILQL